MPLPLRSHGVSGCRCSGSTARLAGQAQKEAFINEAFTRLDALVQPIVLGTLADPPASPTVGDAFLIASTPSAEWAGHPDAIAVWTASQWLFQAPREGMKVHDLSSGGLAVFHPDDGWRRAAAPASPMGGASQDIEARATLAAIVAKLHTLGIFSS